MTTMTTSSYADLLDPSFRQIIKAWADGNEKYYDKCVNVENISTNWVKDSYVTGLGTMPTKTQGSAPTERELTQRLDSTYTAVSYGLKTTVAYELQDDDVSNSRIIKQIPDGIAKSARDALEVSVANLFNNAGSTNLADGVPLLSLLHPYSAIGSSGTMANTPSVGVNLSETVLEDAIVAIETMKDEAQILMGLKAKKLIVAPALEATARKLLGSSLTPSTANNAINVLKGRLELVVNPYITDTNAWFIQADKHYMNCFIREPFTFKSMMATDASRNAIFAGYQRFVTGVTYFMGSYGSMGIS